MSFTTGAVVWCAGLSGSGKTTLCRSVARELTRRNHRVYVLDADEVRTHLCADLGFTIADRHENIRRMISIARLLSSGGIIVLVAAITPLEAMRQTIRSSIPHVIEVFVDAPFDVCETRDPKGLYRKFRDGKLKNFTGVDSPFEVPGTPTVCCRTAVETEEESAQKILQAILTPTEESIGRNIVAGRRSTIAVDFDGVIADYDGWRGPDVLGNPRSDVIYVLSTLRSEDWKIVIHTTRCAEDILAYLYAHHIPFDEINTNQDYPNYGPKPVATVYWDDRAIRYSGDGASDLEVIRSFRTWNGRS